MIKILDKALAEEVRNGEAGVEELAKHLMYNYPVATLAMELAEIMITDSACNDPIVVSPSEMDKITSMFRVRGFKNNEDYFSGEGVGSSACKTERRGRKPKATPAPIEKDTFPFKD